MAIDKDKSPVEDDGMETVVGLGAPTQTQIGGDHYAGMKIQPIDYMHANMTPEAFAGYCRGNILKYASRAGIKSGDVAGDLRKARQYIDFWLASL